MRHNTMLKNKKIIQYHLWDTILCRRTKKKNNIIYETQYYVKEQKKYYTIYETQYYVEEQRLPFEDYRSIRKSLLRF